MGTRLVWNERYNLGVETIDKEHKKLFRILDKLLDFGQQDEKSQWVCQEAVKYFKDHALKHFADEEAYTALEKELERTKYSEDAINHFLGVCAGWLIGHTLIEDHAIVEGQNVKQWENLLPDEEQAIMGQTIVSLLHGMFQLDSQLLSDCYGGEKFGDGIYYRLVYSTKQKKRGEFLLIFEEKLIVSTIGSVIDAKSEAISVMMMNAARYTARQFVEHVKEHFPSLKEADIKDEQLLTYEQFQKVFEKHKPQFSMLFDTGKGYFSFCMTTADMEQNEDGVSIITDNAMSEVEKYLRQNEEKKNAESLKKKILVVDDSLFMLNMMEELLGKDYEVLTVTSGLAAFRSIALDRPDLVLLDYEMPVCDGSQILEMIRSEKGFTDIPVIFLTSRVNRESVEKVIALRPEGYLSKSIPPESIKKEIDRFFEKKKNTPSK